MGSEKVKPETECPRHGALPVRNRHPWLLGERLGGNKSMKKARLHLRGVCRY